MLMLTRLQTARTEKFYRGFIYFVAYITCLQKEGDPDALISAFEQVQPGIFAQLATSLLAPGIAQTRGADRQRRVIVAGAARLLTRSSLITQQPHVAALPPLLTSVATVVYLPAAQRSGPEDADADDMYTFDLEEQGFQASFSQLAAYEG